MKTNVKIAEILMDYLKNNPEIRFTQALTNLGINEFANPKDPGAANHLLRDPYNDLDEVVEKKVYVNLINLHEQKTRNKLGL